MLTDIKIEGILETEKYPMGKKNLGSCTYNPDTQIIQIPGMILTPGKSYWIDSKEIVILKQIDKGIYQFQYRND